MSAGPCSEKRACEAETNGSLMQMSEDGERPTMTGPSMSTWMPRMPRGPLSTSIVQIAESRRWPRTSPTPVFMTANRKI